MQKSSKKIIGLLLVVALCFSIAPVSTVAASGEQTPATSEQIRDIPDITGLLSPEPAPEITPSPEPTAAQELTAQPTPAPESTPVPAIEVIPEYVKVVDKPLVQVVYHYYDEAQNQSIAGFADYAVASSHSYNVMALANDAGITIAANKYPGKVAVSTGALRFRVLLNGNTDITALAEYDAAMEENQEK